LLDDFVGTVDANLSLLDLVRTHVAESDSPRARFREITAGIDGLPPGKRGTLERIAHEHFERFRLESGLEPPKATEHGPDPERLELFFGLVTAIASGAHDVLEDSMQIAQFFERASRIMRRPDRAGFLLRAQVVMGVSAVEVLIAGLVREFYTIKQEALVGEDKEFSLAELKEFGSIEEAITAAIDKRVEQFVWKSFDDWSIWFEKRMNISFSEMLDDWDRTREVFERRHLIVHNEGRVNARYTQRVPEAIRPNLQLGEELPMDEHYGLQALDHLSVLGILGTTLVWAKLLPATDFSTPAANAIYDLMLAGRWEPVAAICHHGKALDCGRSTQLVFQCNEWLARKRLHGLESIEREVGRFDTTGLQIRFSVVRAALLDDLDQAFEILPHALETDRAAGGMIRGELLEWPILEEMRQDPRIADFIPADG
jgi:hypothetical protein